MRNALRIILVYFRVSVMHELSYRMNFFIQVAMSATEFTTAVAVLMMVYAHTDLLGGWNQAELFVLVGVFFVVRGALFAVVWRSLWMFVGQVRNGSLDFILTKPVDAQLLVSVQRLQIWKLADVFLGALTLAVALRWLDRPITAVQAGGFVFLLGTGTMVAYGFIMMLATCVFWLVKADNIMVIFAATSEAARWPIHVYPKWLRVALTFLVPLAFAITVPAEALLGRLTLSTFLGALGVTGLFTVACRWFWLKGLRAYSGASA